MLIAMGIIKIGAFCDGFFRLAMTLDGVGFSFLGCHKTRYPVHRRRRGRLECAKMPID